MSMYTTAQLLAANEQKFKFDPLFLRLFFRESYPFTTEKVYLSQIPGLVNMALYVSPIVSGEVIRSRGGSTSEFTPGYVKPKHEVNPQMTLRRLPDEDPQNLADPAYRRRRIILQNMRDEELAIAQVEEMQAVSAVLKGKYTMTGEAFDPVEVDMGILIQIEIRLIVVAANDQHRQFFRFRLPLSAAAQQRAAQRQQHRQQSFCPAHSLPLMPYTSRHSAPCMSSRQSTSSGSNAPHSPRRIIANASAWVYAGLYTRWLTSAS